MPELRYQDLLWDFTYGGGGRKETPADAIPARLQVYDDERQMFESGRQSKPGYDIHLPTSPNPQDLQKTYGSDRERGGQPIPISVLMETGLRLWKAIPAKERKALTKANPEQLLRLKISSSSSIINDLPWEWLNNGGTPFALLPGIRLVRSVPIRMAIPPISAPSQIRVLLVITNPKDERLLNPGAEIEAVRIRLSAAPYELRILEEPTMSALADALRGEPHIVHYIGHAGIDRGQGNLILHDYRGVSDWISGPELSKVLPPSVRLLCLSTCFTVPNYQVLGLPRLAHTPASYRLPTILANRYAVREPGVRGFWEAFYSTLVDQAGNVNEAYHHALQVVANLSGSESDWGSFSLVIRDKNGLGLNMEQGVTKDIGRSAEEIRAQLISHVANDLAVELSNLGDNAPENIQLWYKQELEHASALKKELWGDDAAEA